MKYDIPYMTTEAVSLLKSLISNSFNQPGRNPSCGFPAKLYRNGRYADGT